ncbi:MAG: hypothetical protein WC628_05755 [Candidatus Omnitrophota bacterium]
MSVKMKKVIRVIFFLSIIHYPLSTVTYAAPAYGTKLPKQKQLFAGLQSYTIFRSNLEKSYGRLLSQQEFLLVSFGIFDWLSLDLKGGAGNIKLRGSDSGKLDYPTYLGGGYGFRLQLLEKGPVRAVFGFQHISIHPKTIYIGAVKHKSVLDDWQFSVLASYAFKKITPYMGARWSRRDYIHWQDGSRKLVKSDLSESVGLIAGLDLPLTEKYWVNLEGSFFDAEAFAFSLSYGF